MSGARDSEHFDTIVIGGGQAGLSVGYHLGRRGVDFVILEKRPRVGDVWRERWDSLRLFTPANLSSLDGMPFPAPGHAFPTKDEMADYLETYAARFVLPVRTGVEVDRLARRNGAFMVEAGEHRFSADNVVVAMANYQKPHVPPFARKLDPSIVQLHSFDYRNPGQLRDGPVLIAGAGNSGSEIAKELAPRHTVFMSGRDTGEIPFRVEGWAGRLFLARLVLRGLFHRVLTVDTAIGRRVRSNVVHRGGPLIRVRKKELARLGVERVPRVTDVRSGRPEVGGGRALDVANVVWCTGFRPGFDWIDLPAVHGDEPAHQSGITEQPGLYFVGLHFLHAMSSAMIHGVGRDADRVASAIAGRTEARLARPAAPGTEKAGMVTTAPLPNR